MQYVRTKNGTVTFDDHGSRWGTVARNLDITVTKFAGYRGEAKFHGGTVWIQDYVPMSMSMKAVFRVEDGIVHFERMTLLTDGAESIITGDADIKNWPEMTYQVKSTVDFKRMRELFFAKDNYTLSGEGRFNGVFHLFKGGRALTGDFESDVAGLQIGGRDYEFPNLKGKLGWYPNRFEVMDTTTGFYGGEASLKYSILSSGKPGQPSNARFDAEWRDVDLADYSDFLVMQGVRLAGRWSGRNLLQWPLGRFRERSGDGYSEVIPPAGAEVLAGIRASESASGPDRGGVHPPIGHLPIAGEVTYRYDPNWVEFSDGRFSTPATDVTFSGRTAWGDDSRIPFHVTSADLQESDRVLAGMMTAFGAPTNPITVGGTAEFSGVMTESLSRPRVEGHFVAEDMRAFDVNWGNGEAGLVIQNSYVDVTGGRMEKDGGDDRRQRTLLARVSAARQGRRDQRPRPRDEVDRRRLQARVRHRRLRRRGDCVGRVPPLRALSGPLRIRHADHRQGRRIRRAVRDRLGLAAIRRQRRAHRQHRDAEERRHRRRRGVRRMERHLFVQRHRPAHSAGERQAPWPIRRRR